MWNWVLIVVAAILPEYAQPEMASDALLIQEGTASFYGRRFHLRKTSNGEIFHMDSLTAAHKTLPFNTRVKVTRVDNGESVWVRINDRLPRNSKRIIDLSRKAATDLGLLHDGITKVRIEVENLQEIHRLIEYYGEEPPATIRLRPVEDPIQIPEGELDLSIPPNF
ncbi:septal ring lytic transglycosylase RlpA family protein [Algoriphagus halophytocola]|uniref:Probable endolytic peptidoglycan transglycosylase RlpA n=1 Tax=Algoriphagus halophytocola TaxID=2991499 RepID=A0ABY6MG67_9BACT|nr:MULTISPECIES: septal ring lytic transglycosylase RlpA family protein [unclassified Algoriphagus]UZD22183.1 septal ring lytic transglycosylase RlpA family protein [Algoriphagus sp. TR-M5]WBL43434.1 septal ring lytic transglycosylase RlpA family protein [Algoriphagus sp. TR-M9]